MLFYDPLGRTVATLHPNHVWAKAVFDAWRQETWDVSDTILIDDPATDADVGDHFRRLEDAHYLPGWYAARAAERLAKKNGPPPNGRRCMPGHRPSPTSTRSAGPS